MNIIDEILTDPEPIDGYKVDKIIASFKKGAAAKPADFHHLESRIYQKFIQDVVDNSYEEDNEIKEVGKKILGLRRINFPRSY